MLRIYGFATQNNGCAKYRIWQPLEVLSRLGLAEVRREPDESGAISAERVDEIFRWADVVVCQPFSELWAAALMLSGRDTHKKKLVVDLDDNIYSVHPLNLGTHEGQLTYLVNEFDGKFEDFWEVEDIPEGLEEEFSKRLDGTVISHGDGFKFIHNLKSDIKLSATTMLEHADMVTTTNEDLLKVFRKVTKSPVAVLPNCLDFKEWGKPKRPKKRGVWLGWAGSMSHYPDLKRVVPMLDRFMLQPELNFHVMGSSFDYLFPPKPGAERIPVAGYQGNEVPMWQIRLEDCQERWPGKMAFDKPVSIQEYVPWFKNNFLADIAIAPLEDNQFNVCKSELKWVENSALGIPTIASKVGPYKRAIKHGEDGLLVTSQGAWTKAISQLIEDPDKRKAIGKAAKERVRKEYDAEKRAPEWLRTYEAIV